MKLLLPLLLLLSGCSTFGEVEALNDAGLGDAREAVSVYHKSLNVLGISSSTPNAAVLNRAYGQVQNTNVDPNEQSDVPFIIRDVNEILRYLK